MANTAYNLQPHGSNNIYQFAEKQGQICGTVWKADVNENYNYQELQVNSNLFMVDGKNYKVSGHVLLRIHGLENIIKTGDVVKTVVLLKEPALPGNFGEFNYRDYLARQRIFLTGSIPLNQIETIKHNNEINLISIIYNTKSQIIRQIEKIYTTNPGKMLVKAIITGERTGITQELKGIFQDAGVMHILAISGLHVGIFTVILLFLFNLIPEKILKKKFKYFIIIGIMLGYAAMTGFRPSVSRAAIMFAIVLIGRYFNRPYHIYNSLYLSAMIILLCQPLYLYDAGFLLSFLVTFAIVAFAPIIEAKLPFLPEYLRKIFSVSLSAWLGVLPLSAYFFYKVSLISILANIVIVPMIGIIIVIALISIVVSFVFLPLAGLIALCNNFLIEGLVMIGQRLSLLPFAYKYIAQPGILTIIFYYFIIVIIFYSLYFWSKYDVLKKKRRFWVIVSCSFVLLVGNLLFPQSLLAVHFINVGQGDCIFIQTPKEKNILIDGGGTPFSDFDVGINTVIPYLRRKGVNHIDVMFLTHPDLDHLEGLLPVLEEMKVTLVVDNELEYPEENYLAFKSFILENENISYYQTQAGDLIKISPEIEFAILNPIKRFEYSEERDFNNNSIVLKLHYKNASFLFTGDIEKNAEMSLLSNTNSSLLKCDILKVAHHGSNSSTSKTFLNNVEPQIAVISVGLNNFGHPHLDVVKRLENKCQKVFRTDLNGTIIIKTDGKKYYISTLR
jgi:competence protein ComEC